MDTAVEGDQDDHGHVQPVDMFRPVPEGDGGVGDVDFGDMSVSTRGYIGFAWHCDWLALDYMMLRVCNVFDRSCALSTIYGRNRQPGRADR